LRERLNADTQVGTLWLARKTLHIKERRKEDLAPADPKKKAGGDWGKRAKGEGKLQSRLILIRGRQKRPGKNGEGGSNQFAKPRKITTTRHRGEKDLPARP